MKRSQINRIMRDTLDFLQQQHVCLPPLVRWTPE